MKTRSKATQILRAMLARRYGFGASPNKRRLWFVATKALLATMSLTLERRKETALLRGSNLSYNEGVIGLTGHCLSFHARTGKL